MQSVPEIDAQSLVAKKNRWLRFPKLSRLFLITVVAPTLVATVYYGLIASDVYVSESRFIIRGPQSESKTGLGAILQGTGFSRSEDDAHSVHDYVLSRDAVKLLNQKLNLTNMFDGKNIDIFSRFSPLGIGHNTEELYKYYQKHVGLDTDSTSSISVLQVRAYSAEDAFNINKALLEMSENLINQLNARALQDTIQFAASEVKEAEARDTEAALALSEYRNKKAIFDPERQSALQLQTISKLQDDLIATTTQLAQMQRLAPENPQVPSLRERAATLQDQIKLQMNEIAGGDKSLTNKSAEFERLTLNLAFADKQLGLALASLEQSRSDAQRKQLYLEKIVQPSLPDASTEPRRLRGILTTLVLGLVVMGVLNILIAGIKEHKD